MSEEDSFSRSIVSSIESKVESSESTSSSSSNDTPSSSTARTNSSSDSGDGPSSSSSSSSSSDDGSSSEEGSAGNEVEGEDDLEDETVSSVVLTLARVRTNPLQATKNEVDAAGKKKKPKPFLISPGKVKSKEAKKKRKKEKALEKKNEKERAREKAQDRAKGKEMKKKEKEKEKDFSDKNGGKSKKSDSESDKKVSEDSEKDERNLTIPSISTPDRSDIPSIALESLSKNVKVIKQKPIRGREKRRSGREEKRQDPSPSSNRGKKPKGKKPQHNGQTPRSTRGFDLPIPFFRKGRKRSSSLEETKLTQSRGRKLDDEPLPSPPPQTLNDLLMEDGVKKAAKGAYSTVLESQARGKRTAVDTDSSPGSS